MDYRELCRAAREVNIRDMLMSMGADVVVGKKNNNYQIGGETVVHSPGEFGWFTNSHKSGRGALDLYMMLSDMNVNDKFAIERAAKDILGIGNGTLRVVEHPTTASKAPTTPPVPSGTESRLIEVKSYLIERGIDEQLIDDCISDGTIYAAGAGGKFGFLTNAVFLGTLGNAGDGCEMKGASFGKDGKRVKFSGKLGTGAYFMLPTVDPAQPTAIVEATIEALSLRTLGWQGSIVSSGGNFGDDFIDLLRGMGGEFVAASNNDGEKDALKGGRMAANLYKAFGVRRIKPTLNDWNDCLRAGLSLDESIERNHAHSIKNCADKTSHNHVWRVAKKYPSSTIRTRLIAV